jgi:TonB family protein
MHTRALHTSAVLGAVLAAAVIGLSVSAPASAASRVTFGPLIPAPPIYTIDTAASVGTCPIADSDAQMTSVFRPQWLEAVASQSSHASAQIQLDLDSVGNLLAASVANSSGNVLLDQQALAAARGSKYAPEVRNCNSFKRTYFLTITVDNAMITVPAGSGSAMHQPVK